MANDGKVTTDTKLDEQELAVLDQLGLAANLFFKLEIIHPSDTSEFALAIHQAQNIVLARAGMRQIRSYIAFHTLPTKTKEIIHMESISLGPLTVWIEVDGQRTPIYQTYAAPDFRYWIAGEAGKPYAIVVQPSYGGRMEVLESIDGRDVLKDQPASLRNNGMVINNTWRNFGWRIDDQTTRDFVFGSPDQSIAAQAAGDITNVGVIGIAAFVERTYVPLAGELKGIGNAVVRSSFAVTDSAADLGTGMGQARADAVGTTQFTRRNPNTPDMQVQIQYRSRDWLVMEGILRPDLPNAWPGDSQTGYGKYAK